MIALRSPMHALLWKEWRQLRHLRWVCVAIGVLLPVFFFAGAEASRQGLSPFGSSSSYTMRDIFLKIVPPCFVFGLWPLAALLITAQTFAGDRGAGTEGFLLERPVPRRKFWTARLTASLLSLSTVLAGTSAFWYGAQALLGGPGAQGHSDAMGLFGVGVVLSVLAALCCTLASSLLASPILAILATVLLAVLPAFLSLALGHLFPYVGWGTLPFGIVFPWLHVPLYLVVSYLVSCTGEPAGRDRVARGAGSLIICVIVVLFAFVGGSQAMLRYDAHLRLGPSYDLGAAPRGDRILLGAAGTSHVWLLDTTTARVVQDYPGPLGDAVWRPDGAMFALMSCSGPLGSRGRCRIGFFDHDGQPAAIPWYSADDEIAYQLEWYGHVLTFIVSAGPKAVERVFFEPGKGEIGRITGSHQEKSRFVGMLWDGNPAVEKITPIQRGGAGGTRAVYRLRLPGGTLDPSPLFEEPLSEIETRFGLGGELSADGRWWARIVRPRVAVAESLLPRPARGEMVDLRTGRVVPAVQGGWPDDPIRFYLQQDGDATVLIEEGRDRPSTKIRSWSHVLVDTSLSPSSRYLLVKLDRGIFGVNPSGPPGATRSASEASALLFDVEAGNWKELPAVMQSTKRLVWNPPRWAGPRTLLVSQKRSLSLVDVDALDRPRYIVGGP